MTLALTAPAPGKQANQSLNSMFKIFALIIFGTMSTQPDMTPQVMDMTPSGVGHEYHMTPFQ